MLNRSKCPILAQILPQYAQAAINRRGRHQSDAADKDIFGPLVVAGYRLANSDVLQNEVKIAELVPEIFSGDRFLVGGANLFSWEKCTE